MVLKIILICLLILMVYCYSENLCLKMTDYTLEQARIPQDLDGHRLLLLSDLHCIRHGRNNSRLFRMIEDSGCDMIVIAGDLINGRKISETSYADEILKGLKDLGIPVYYAYGNHELRLSWRDPSYPALYRQTVESSGIKLLDNSLSQAGERTDAYIYGFTLPLEYDRGRTEAIKGRINVGDPFASVPETAYRIMVAHDPVFIDRYLGCSPDLILSGHIHGGMIRLPFIGGLLSPRRSFFPVPDKGLYKYGNSALVVSGGIGWHTIPFRFMNRPELVRITFKRGQK